VHLTTFAFERLKWCFTTAPVLHCDIFNPRRRRRGSVLTTDASEIVISSVLMQPDDDGVHHPVAYEGCFTTTFSGAGHLDRLAPDRTSRCAPSTRR
jgi:hypothetical protein